MSTYAPCPTCGQSAEFASGIEMVSELLPSVPVGPAVFTTCPTCHQSVQLPFAVDNEPPA
jgi:endogenous inhibitor of DNA gyrase (YacG/DUF329 family)